MSMRLALLLAAAARCRTRRRPAWSTHVDPFIGTGGHGHTFPGPTLPFGMVQLSPDTRLTGWDGCSGYHFSDDVVFGFSHTHLSGTGVSDYGDILLMPVTGEPLLETAIPTEWTRATARRFDKADEQAERRLLRGPSCTDYGIDVELTATPARACTATSFPPASPAT